MGKKIVTIMSGIERSLGMESYLRGLSRSKYTNTIVLLHSAKGPIADILEKEGLEVIWIRYRGKKDLIGAFRTLVGILKKVKPDIVHTHLFEGSFVGIHAARFCGIKKRISTRHHSSFHHVSHSQAVKYDRWINACSTHIISISETITRILLDKEKVEPSKVTLIHHGFDLRPYAPNATLDSSGLKTKYSLTADQVLIGVIARATEWKGLDYILKAFQKLYLKFPNTVLLLGNLEGEYKQHLLNTISALPPRSYRILEYETNPAILYKLFDLFVHTPVDDHSEAFGQVYVEALAAGKPCVFTASGIGNSLCEHEVNCLVVRYRDSESILLALERLLTDPALLERLSKSGPVSVSGKFELSEMIQKLEELYDR